MAVSKEVLKGGADFLCRAIAGSDCISERKRDMGRSLEVLCLNAGEDSDIFRLASEISGSLDKMLELKRRVNKLCEDLRKKVDVWEVRGDK